MLKLLSILNPILLFFSLFYLIRSLKLIRGSRLEGVLLSLGFFIAILFIKSVPEFAQVPKIFDIYLDEFNFEFIVEGLAYLGLLVCTFFIFRNYRRSFVSFWEKSTVLLLLIGGAVLTYFSCRSIIDYFGANPYTVRSSLLIGMGLFMAIVLIPTYFNYFRSKFFLSWCRIGLGLFLLTSVNYLDMVVETRSLGLLLVVPAEIVRTLSYWFLAIGLFSYRRAQLRVVLPEHPFEEGPALSERESMEHIFKYFVESFFSLYGSFYGRVNQLGLEKKWNAVAEKEQDPIRINSGKCLHISGPTELLKQSQRCQKYLKLTYEMLVNYCGTLFVNKHFKHLCQELFWTEKDIADNHFLIHLPFGKRLVTQEEEKEADLKSLLKDIPIFHNLTDEEIAELVSRFKRKNYRKGKRILREGAMGDQFFVLAFGECDVLKQVGFRRTRVVQLRQGDYFGERALLENKKRGATIVARTPVVAYLLKKEDFLGILKTYFDVLPKMKQFLDRLEFLKTIPLFSTFSQIQLLYMASKMSAVTFKEGEVILKLGESGETFFVIEDGEVEVYREDGGEPKTISQLGKGECFGEMALLKTGKRTANVRAVSPLVCYQLNKKDFDLLFSGCNYNRKKLEKLILRREEDLKKKSA